MTISVRDAVASDAAEISAFLQELTALGKRVRPDSEDFVREYYIGDPLKVSCSVAVDETGVLGFQTIKLAEAGNPWDVTPGWGIIGTHIRPSAARRGVGRALFAVSLAKAREAGLEHLDASIGSANAEGLGYYDAMGFRTYRTPGDLICKRFDL